MTSVKQVTIPEGYKKSEVGVIPEDWVVTTIESVVSITTGNKNTQDKVVDGLYPFYVRSQTVESINSYTFDGEGVLTAGDGVGTGKIFHYINGKCDIHQRVYLMHKFTDRLHGYYFYIYFKNNFYDKVMSMTAKSSVDSVRREMIADMYIALPSLKEQTAIANALSDVDNLIAALETLITKKSAIKTAAMQQLLTGKKRLPAFANQGEEQGEEQGEKQGEKQGHHQPAGSASMADASQRKDSTQTAPRPGYKQTELGEMPEDWEVVELGELLKYEQPTKYLVSSAEYMETGVVPVLTAGKSFILGYTAETNELFTNLPVIIFDDFTTDSKYVDFQFKAKSSAMKMLTPKDKKTPVNLIHSMLSSVDFKVGDHKRHWISEFSKLKVKWPKDIKEQTAIANVLSDMDAELDALQQRLSKTQQIKQGMMQELLTGKTRLINSREVRL